VFLERPKTRRRFWFLRSPLEARKLSGLKNHIVDKVRHAGSGTSSNTHFFFLSNRVRNAHWFLESQGDLWYANIPSVLSSERDVGTYLLSFSIPQDQKSDGKPSQVGCLCAILTPHVTLLPQRRTLIHFVLWFRFRFDRRWISFTVSDRSFAFSPQRRNPVPTKTAGFL
jgi:hypothetical protein